MTTELAMPIDGDDQRPTNAVDLYRALTYLPQSDHAQSVLEGYEVVAGRDEALPDRLEPDDLLLHADLSNGTGEFLPIRSLARVGAGIVNRFGQLLPGNLLLRPKAAVPTGPPAPEFRTLLRYLGLTEARFASGERAYFRRLRELLSLAGSSPPPTLNRSNFADAVRAFQTSRRLGSDGVPGAQSLWALQRDWAANRKLAIVRVPADHWRRPGGGKNVGYDSFRFREDAAPLYVALRNDVISAGGILTSSGSLRSLRAKVRVGRSTKSMHYSGLAFDLAVGSGMHDARIDPYLITAEGRRWRVWARAKSGAQRTLDAVEYSRRRRQTTTRRTTASVVDFTALAEKHGFQRIGHRSSFPANYLSAEWWHFQATTLLHPWISQFGIELLSLAEYDEPDLRRNQGIWANRLSIFGRRHRSGWR